MVAVVAATEVDTAIGMAIHPLTLHLLRGPPAAEGPSVRRAQLPTHRVHAFAHNAASLWFRVHAAIAMPIWWLAQNFVRIAANPRLDAFAPLH